MQPEVTVIMPVLNGEAYLQEAITCVLNQSFKDFRLFIVDNGSHDRSLEIINHSIRKDNRISLIRNPDKNGMVENWNFGLKNSKSSWIKFQFQDDMMLPMALEEMLELALSEDLNVVLTDREYFWGTEMSDEEIAFYSNLNRLSTYSPTTGVIYPKEIIQFFSKELLEINFLGEPIVGLINQEIVTKYGGFDRSLSQLVDFEYWLRICSNERTGFINKKLNRFRVHSLSESKRNMNKKELNPTTRDIILIGLKILSHPDFNKLRVHLLSFGVSLEKYLRKVIKIVAENHGQKFILDEFGGDAIFLLKHSFWRKSFGKNSRLDVLVKLIPTLFGL